jgi:hypothetical protein
MAPSFIPHGPTHPVMLALDDSHLTQWIGEPPTVWQTPLTEVRDLEVRAGRSITLRATIGGVRYRWSARRAPEHDTLIDQVRALGVVNRDKRAWQIVALTAAIVVLAASAASFAATSIHSNPPATSLASRVGAINVTKADLPTGWGASPDGTLAILLGRPGASYPSATTPVAPTGLNGQIWQAASTSFQSCMGVSASADRMFGAAGQQPKVQVTGSVYGTSVDGGPEIGSLTQYYAQSAMVVHDVDEYNRPAFGRCWGQVSAQLFAGEITQTASATKSKYITQSFSPATFVHAFKSGGVATVSIPGAQSLTLVSVFAAEGHYEINLYAITSNWSATRPTVVAALDAMLSRAGTPGGTPA